MTRRFSVRLLRGLAPVALLMPTLALAQTESVRPGINDSFRDPDPAAFVERFETESREVFAEREAIVEAVGAKPGQVVADIGAGTGLFTRLFARSVGPSGTVYAVDISQNFLDHIDESAKAADLTNVKTVLAEDDATGLPPASIDVAFICDTYHHFEYPIRTMTSLARALKPGGRVVLIDFRRIEGVSREWTMNHVRAGQETFEAEIAQAGFRKVAEKPDLLEENYLVIFEKSTETASADALLFPIVAGHGGVRPRPNAAEPPRAGAKVVVDLTAATEPGKTNPGLERVARLINLYGAAGLKAQDVTITVVAHGAATSAVLTDAATNARGRETNGDLPVIRKLRDAGVEFLVCGQALGEKGYRDDEVADGVGIAVSALTTVVNKQTDGYAYLPMR